MLGRVLSFLAVAALASLSGATAHGVLHEPSPTMTKKTTGWVVEKPNYWPEIGSRPKEMITKFASLAKERGVTVRDVLEEMAPDQKCGYTNPNGKPQPVPTNGFAVFRSNAHGGFGHQGPCEVWLDDKLVGHGDDCENNFPGGPSHSNVYSKIPVDYSSCKGTCMLRFFWLAFQGARWQAYINCVPLQGNGAAAPAAAASDATPTPASPPAPTTAKPTTPKPTSAPAPTTAKPTSAPAPTTAKPTSAPAPITDKPTSAPAPTTAKPASGKSCNRLRN